MASNCAEHASQGAADSATADAPENAVVLRIVTGEPFWFHNGYLYMKAIVCTEHVSPHHSPHLGEFNTDHAPGCEEHEAYYQHYGHAAPHKENPKSTTCRCAPYARQRATDSEDDGGWSSWPAAVEEGQKNQNNRGNKEPMEPPAASYHGYAATPWRMAVAKQPDEGAAAPDTDDAAAATPAIQAAEAAVCQAREVHDLEATELHARYQAKLDEIMKQMTTHHPDKFTDAQRQAVFSALNRQYEHEWGLMKWLRQRVST